MDLCSVTGILREISRNESLPWNVAGHRQGSNEVNSIESFNLTLHNFNFNFSVFKFGLDCEVA
jgi:hypothetical protein